ncbi:MAG: presqualene diphosphate synthase HpnD [Mariprofundales bacterium]|nr:presqualene diphosphate synthase HpnD [Mariprofundales bacterium]
MTPQQYCEQRTRGAGSSFFYAFLFLPAEQRRAMMALYAFCREVDDIADEVKDREVAHTKLAFWQQQIEMVFDRSPPHLSQSAIHPVGEELQWVRANFAIRREPFNELMLGMKHDIDSKPISSDDELTEYCYRVAGTVGELTITIFGYKNPQSREFATTLGYALQLTNILRDVAEDARLGRIYLPQQQRILYRVADQDLIDGTLHPGVEELLNSYGKRAEDAYQQALTLLPAEDRSSLKASLTMGAIYYHYLLKLKRIEFDVWQHPVSLSPLRKIWIAWRVWRRESGQHSGPVRL